METTDSKKTGYKLPDIALITTFVTAYVYLCTWLYEYGSSIAFNIPAYIIEPTISTVLAFGGIIFGIIFVLFVLLPAAYTIVADKDSLKICGYVLLVAYLAIVIVETIRNGFSFKGCLILLGFCLSILLIVFLIGWVDQKMRKKSTKERIFYSIFTADTPMSIISLQHIKEALGRLS